MWRCVICGRLREAAQRKRKRLGLPVLATRAKVCSPSCAKGREKRLLRKKYGPGSTYHERALRRGRAKRKAEARSRRDEWSCVVCGCDLDAAQAKRRREGEKPITTVRAKTCSAECRHKHRLAVIARWQREHPEQRVEHQRRTYARRAARGK